MAGFAPIQGVDVGGLIGVYEGAKDRRVRQMLLERQIAAENRAIEKEAKIAGAYKNLFTPQSKGGDPASAGSGAVASPPTTAPTDGPPPPVAMNPDGTPPSMAPVAPSTVVDPAHLAPRTDGITLNQDALRELYALDPQAAITVQKHVFDANEAQLKHMSENGERIASVAYHLMQVPQQERAAELAAMAPMLAQSGIDASMLSQADLSDRGLQRYLRIGQSYKDLVTTERDDRKFAETQRHNRATEANAAGGLEVRRGALGLAREREGRVAAGKGGASADVGGLSTADLIRMAGGGE